MKPFNFGMIIGRFNHMHIGHMHMIQKGLAVSEHVLLMVGSSQESFTLRNPFTCKSRMDIIRAAFKQEIEEGRLFIAHIPDLTHENDHSPEWGDYVLERIEMWRNYFNIPGELDLFIFGNDEERSTWYRPTSIAKVTQLVVARGTVDISATRMREFIIQGNLNEWMHFMPRGKNDEDEREMIELFWELREELLRIPEYQILAEGVVHE